MARMGDAAMVEDTAFEGRETRRLGAPAPEEKVRGIADYGDARTGGPKAHTFGPAEFEERRR